MSLLHLVITAFIVTTTNGVPFAWENCGKPDNSVKVLQLNVTDGSDRTVLVTGRSKVAQNLDIPLQGQLVLMKKMIWGWTKIPCVDGVGSCNYDDVCSLSPYKPNNCPREFTDNHLPCTCPILEGNYSAKRFPISLSTLPHWMESGRYKITATISANSTQLLCLQLDITIK